jgi:drug/metabolite transporter (DMT)-like permease
VNKQELFRLIALAAIWGASFLFMRILSPAVGAFIGADVRLLIGGIALIFYLWWLGEDARLLERARVYTHLGLFNSGMPFILYSAAALTLPASYSAVLNALAPLFGALFMWTAEGERLSPRKIAGMIVALLGVAIMSRLGPIPLTLGTLAAILACIAATACYGWAGLLIRRRGKNIAPTHLAAGTQLAAGLVILPLAIGQAYVVPPVDPFNPLVVIAAISIGVLCSGVAYFLYFRLIRDSGPTRALTVTYIIPVFGILWAALFLGERVTPGMLLGAVLVLVGTFLVLR